MKCMQKNLNLCFKMIRSVRALIRFSQDFNFIIIVDVLDYIKNFKWDDTKYHRGRSLVELAGVITEVDKY